MPILLKVLLLVSSTHLLQSATEEKQEPPFWRNKPKIYKQILEQRKVVVSVSKQEQGKEKRLRILGGGVVNVPLYFALQQVTRFEDLPQVSGYFKKVVHKKDKKEVYFHIKALGREIRMLQSYSWAQRTEAEARMDWQVTWGVIKGMQGYYAFRKVGPSQTEVVIWATLQKLDLPLPEFLVGFTLEVIAEKTAQKMRSFMEDKYRNLGR